MGIICIKTAENSSCLFKGLYGCKPLICTCWEDYFRRVDVVATKLLISFGSVFPPFFSMKVARDHVYTCNSQGKSPAPSPQPLMTVLCHGD